MNLTDLQFEKQKEVEKLFAACAFIDPVYVRDTCGWLAPDLLVDARIRKFWELVLDGKTGIEASYETDLDIELLKWMVQTPSSLYAREYANVITNKNYMAGISIQLSKIAAAISENDIALVQRSIDEMAAHQRGGKEDLPGVEQIGLEFIEAVTAENNDIPTGIPKLDNNIGGLERHTTSVLAARTSMGKTSMALQIARNVAGPGGKKVIFFSLEMKRKSLWARMACGNAEVSWLDKRAGKITPEDEQRLLQESDLLMDQLQDRFYVIDDTADTDRIWQITASEKPDLVVVDHLRLVKDKGTSEVKRQGLITERLHDLSKAQNCHVMILAQLNRAVEQRSDQEKRPLLADLRDSGEIEENADLVLMLHRPDYYSGKNPGRYSETELIIRKFRDGIRQGVMKLSFDTQKQWFTVQPGG